MCKVSVIMGVYNGERFLREAIESVLNQSFHDFEFIICNDCSKDSSLDILKEYEQKDSRVHLIENEMNMGLASSLNRCIDIAQGEYLARMDCDDICLPNRFAEELSFLDSHPDISVVGTGVSFIDDGSNIYGQKCESNLRLITIEDAVKCSQLVHPTVMMRTEHIREVGGYSVNKLTTRAEDYDLWCKLCEFGCKLAVIPEVLFCYREDMSNIVKRKYRYRIQETKLKKYWTKRAKMPFSYFRFIVRPLLIGLIPLSMYKKMHRKKLCK